MKEGDHVYVLCGVMGAAKKMLGVITEIVGRRITVNCGVHGTGFYDESEISTDPMDLKHTHSLNNKPFVNRIIIDDLDLPE